MFVDYMGRENENVQLRGSNCVQDWKYTIIIVFCHRV